MTSEHSYGRWTEVEQLLLQSRRAAEYYEPERLGKEIRMYFKHMAPSLQGRLLFTPPAISRRGEEDQIVSVFDATSLSIFQGCDMINRAVRRTEKHRMYTSIYKLDEHGLADEQLSNSGAPAVYQGGNIHSQCPIDKVRDFDYTLSFAPARTGHASSINK